MNGVTDMSSIVPPARITDLRMMSTENRDIVLLQWTAVGANMDQGTGECQVMKILFDDYKYFCLMKHINNVCFNVLLNIDRWITCQKW